MKMMIELQRSEKEPATANVNSSGQAGWPEIVPKFSEAIIEWKAAWPIHVYLTSIAYILILLISIYLFYLKIQS